MTNLDLDAIEKRRNLETERDNFLLRAVELESELKVAHKRIAELEAGLRNVHEIREVELQDVRATLEKIDRHLLARAQVGSDFEKDAWQWVTVELARPSFVNALLNHPTDEPTNKGDGEC